MNRRERIEETLVQRFGLQHLDVTDESHGHSVSDGAESHFKVVAVSEEFAGKRLIQRHRMINELLESEFAGGMHARSHNGQGTELDHTIGPVSIYARLAGWVERQRYAT